MIYRIVHITTYKYKSIVSVGNYVAYLTPRTLIQRQLARSELLIQPPPATRSERLDYFGNLLCLFTIQEPHMELTVEARSEVIMKGRSTPWPQQSPPWEEAAGLLFNDQSPAGLKAYQFGFESPRIRLRPEFASYAHQSFTYQRPMHEGLLDLTARIHSDFRFDKKVTSVRTPVEEVFRKRRGGYEDFAHLQIACLRSVNVAARYVCGYRGIDLTLSRPRPAKADAPHAWVSAYCPRIGWLDMDPTDNLTPSNSHVTLAWGRDSSDVIPLRGSILGGDAHTLRVTVDIEALDF